MSTKGGLYRDIFISEFLNDRWIKQFEKFENLNFLLLEQHQWIVFGLSDAQPKNIAGCEIARGVTNVFVIFWYLSNSAIDPLLGW